MMITLVVDGFPVVIRSWSCGRTEIVNITFSLPSVIKSHLGTNRKDADMLFGSNEMVGFGVS